MKFSLIFFVVLSFGIIKEVWACDPCAIYSSSRIQGYSENSVTLSLSEQYTNYDRASAEKENSVKNGERVRGYSTTQVAIDYGVSNALGVQLTIPVVARNFDRIENYRNETDSDSGLGDISLVSSYSLIRYRSNDWNINGGITAGIKLPSGDTGILEDVSEELDESGGVEERKNLRHHQIGSASGGRALTFGTGSYDYIIGLSALTRFQRYILLTNAQYTLRTEGDFNYEFADDLLWSVGPGYYFVLDHDFTAAGMFAVSGEFKGRDQLDSELVKGSQVSNLYIGPEALLTIDENIGIQAGIDFRVSGEDVDASVVPNWRLRTNVAYRF